MSYYSQFNTDYYPSPNKRLIPITYLDDSNILVSQNTKSIIKNEKGTTYLEGIYLLYLITSGVTWGTSPTDTDLDGLIDTSFISGWTPATNSIIRNDTIEVLIEKDSLPDNFNKSSIVVFGVKDLMLDNTYYPIFGIGIGNPIPDTNQNQNIDLVIDSQLNNTISIPIKFKNNIKLISNPRIKTLEEVESIINPDFLNNLSQDNYINTSGILLKELDSESSDTKSDLDSSDISGTIPII